MKKYLSLLLVVAMLLMVMAGCTTPTGDTSPSDDATEEVSESPSPSTSEEASPSEEEPSPSEEESDAIRWNGGVVGNGESVVAIVPTLQAESVVAWSNVWAEEMEAAGYSATVVSAETTVANYVTLIEDYTQEGVAGMFIAPMDADAIKDATLAAMEKDIVIVFLGGASETFDPSGGVNTDYYYTGYGAVQLAIDWLKKEASLDTSSPVKIATNTYYDDINGSRRSEGYMDAIDESDLLELGYDQSFYTSEEEGYVFAQNAMTADPDIRIFVTYEADTARGVNSYLMNEYLPANTDLTAEDFLVVSAYYDEAAVEEVDKAEADPSSTAFRAYVTYGAGNTETGWSIAYIHLSLLSGQEKAPFWYYDSVSSRTSWGGIGTYERAGSSS